MAGFARKVKKSPLKTKPLRLAGQSLRDERDRVIDEDLMPPFVIALVAVAVTLLEWWRWFVKVPPQPGFYTFLAVCAIGYCAYRTWKIRPQLASLKLGLQGEVMVGQYLDSHRGADWCVFHDIPGPDFNVDHVVVTPKGVFTVETKTRSKPRGNAVVTYDGKKVLVDGFAPDRDPVVQASAARRWVHDLLLETTAIDYPVRGVVLFPGWFVESPSNLGRNDVWVLNEKGFVKYVENGAAVIKDEDVALAAARLANHVTNWADAQHV